MDVHEESPPTTVKPKTNPPLGKKAKAQESRVQFAHCWGNTCCALTAFNMNFANFLGRGICPPVVVLISLPLRFIVSFAIATLFFVVELVYYVLWILTIFCFGQLMPQPGCFLSYYIHSVSMNPADNVDSERHPITSCGAFIRAVCCVRAKRHARETLFYDLECLRPYSPHQSSTQVSPNSSGTGLVLNLTPAVEMKLVSLQSPRPKSPSQSSQSTPSQPAPIETTTTDTITFIPNDDT